ncbi:hypothetical protein GCM10009613_36440 [Pseudonocardia kongjuensis]|uniref:Uncharacterized protein n=1 Tax=Pseudonocardia kongjuensis TaxID=102227 RepID=A0ABP4IJQ4_9PSEU
MRPRILQTDDRAGFGWANPDGSPTTLRALVATDDEPDRLVATHLAALDDALIDAAQRYGELLGGGRRPDPAERESLSTLYRVFDRLVHDVVLAARELGIEPDVRTGQIVGTSTLVSVRAREPLGLLGPAPLDDELDRPGPGVVGGFGEMCRADPARPWAGGRWIVRTEDGRRLPLTLSTLLFDSSGVNKDAARREHREALRSVVDAAADPAADPLTVACAVDWLLYDFLMAHREHPDSAAVVLGAGGAADAALVVDAAVTSVTVRAGVDPGLLAPAPASR